MTSRFAPRMAMVFCLSCLIGIRQGRADDSSLRPTFDQRTLAMCLSTPQWPRPEAIIQTVQCDIPKIIFQIWFGGGTGPWWRHLEGWHHYAKKFGFDYRVYTDADINEILEEAPDDVKQLFWQFFSRREFRGASDIARYLILHKLGGIYVDADMRMPYWRGDPFDISLIVDFKNILLVSDGAPVDWGVGGLHVLNGLMGSCPHHPIVTRMLRSISRNTECCLQDGQSSAVFLTGPGPLNLLLTGPIQLLPIVFWEALGVPDPEWR